MAVQNYEFTGKTVDEAVAEGLKALKLRPDQVDIEVLNKGSRGIFGIGSEPAHVRLTPHAEMPAKVEAPAKTEAPAPPPAEPVAPMASAPTETVTQTQPPVVAEPNSRAASAALASTPATPAVQESVSPAVTENQELVSEQASSRTESVAEPAAPIDDDALVQLAVDLLSKMVKLLGFDAQIVPTWKDANDKMGEYDERYLLLDIHGGDLGALIGRRGETLDNIQYLLRLMVNQRLRQWKNIVVDVEQYKARRVTQLTQLALRMAEQVTSSGRSISLEPMPANERRVVHLALRDHPSVYTESTGEGERRKVNIVAKH